MFEGLDPYVKSWEEFFKIPSGNTTKVWVPETIGRIVEVISDLTLADLGGKIFKTVLGAVIGTVPQRIPGVPDRAVAELQQIATHLSTEFVDPSPEDLVRIANSIAELRAGITFGDWSRIARAFGVKTPEEITADMKTVVDAFSRAFGITRAPAAPPPAEGVAPPPAPTVFPPPTMIEVPGFG
jgi:hypothetical protein